MAIEHLVPSANASPSTILATNDYTLINETVASADGSVNDTDINDTTGTSAVWALTNLPEFGTLNSATFRVRARAVNPGSGDTYEYQFQLAIGGDTFNLLYDTATDENNGFTNYSTVLSGGASYPYSEAQFNAATITLTQTAYNKSGGRDDFYLDVDAVELEVDYVAPIPITVTPTGVAGTGAVGTVTVTTGVGITTILDTNSVSTYYYDGTTTDNDSVWTDDVNAADGSTSTYAYTSTTGAFTTNELSILSIEAAALNIGIVSLVRGRFYGSVEGSGGDAVILGRWDSPGLGGNVRNITAATHAAGWSDYGGQFSSPWRDKQVIVDSYASFYATDGTGTLVQARGYRSELEVTHELAAEGQVGDVTIIEGLGVTVSPAGIAATGEVNPLEDTASYYLDGSWYTGDFDAVWTNDANAWDGSTATGATVSVNGSSSVNELRIGNTNAPSTGEPITQVRARIYGLTNATGVNLRSLHRYESTTVGTPSVVGVLTPGWGSYVILDEPVGGPWTWTDLSGNKIQTWSYTTGTGTPGGELRKIELEVSWSIVRGDCTFAVTGLEATGVIGGTESASTYYFDGATTDPDSAWTNDANAADGSTSTYAETTVFGTPTLNELKIPNPAITIPSSGQVITQVQARTYGSIDVVGTERQTTLFVTPAGHPNFIAYIDSATPDWSAWEDWGLDWTWVQVQDTWPRWYAVDEGGTLTSSRVYRTEVEVTVLDPVTISADANVAVTGVAATGAVGDVTVEVSGATIVPVTGVAGTGAVGSATVTGDCNVSPTGVAGTGVVGSVAIAIAKICLVVGIATTGVVGTVIPVGEASAPVTGVSGTGAVGTVTITADANAGGMGLSDSVLDTFTDPDGTLLTAHTPDLGSSWVNISSTGPEINSNQLEPLAGSFNEQIIDSGVSDCTITANTHMGPTASDSMSLIFRLVETGWPTTEHWLLGTDAAGYTLYSFSGIDGNQSWYNDTLGSNINTTRAVKVVLHGDSVRAYVDGTLLFDVVDSSNNTATKHGFRSFGSDSNWLDDFRVDSEGIVGTGEVGSVIVGVPETFSVTGIAGTGSVGSPAVTGDANVTVTGVAGTGEVGTVIATGAGPIAVSVTGIAATGEIGTPTVTVAATFSVTGSEGTGAVGSVTVTGEANVSVTGIAGTGAVGSVTVIASGTISVPVTGVAATGEIGTVTVTGEANVSVTGIAGTGAVGTVTIIETAAVTVTPTGVAGTGVVGASTITGDSSLTTTGLNADVYYFDGTTTDNEGVWTDDVNATDGSIGTYAYTGTAGTFTLNELQVAGHTGPSYGGPISDVRGRFYGSVEGSGGLASIWCRWSGTGTPVTRSVTAAAHAPEWTPWADFGTTWDNWGAISSAGIQFYGNDFTGSLVEGRAYKSELEITSSATSAVGQVGSVVVTAPKIVPVTGVAGTGEIGTPTVTGEANLTVTGIAGTGAVGTVTILASGTVTFGVAGVAGTGEIGTLTVTGEANFAVTGVAATGEIGTVTVEEGASLAFAVTGVSGTGAVGTVTVTGDANVAATGLSGTGQIGTSVVTGKANVAVTGLAGTGAVGTVSASGIGISVTVVALDSEKGYFDASISGPTDADANWTDDANAFDGDKDTGSTGTLPYSPNWLVGKGNTYGTLPSANSVVEWRIYASIDQTATSKTVGTLWDNGATVLLSANTYISSLTTDPLWSPWATVDAPGGTWSQAELDNLEARYGIQYTKGVLVDGTVYTSELRIDAVKATGEVGSVTISIGSDAAVTGSEASGQVGEVWIIHIHTPNQEPGWTEITAPGTSWTGITPTQTSGWAEIEPTQDSDWEDGTIGDS